MAATGKGRQRRRNKGRETGLLGFRLSARPSGERIPFPALSREDRHPEAFWIHDLEPADLADKRLVRVADQEQSF